MEIQIEAAVLKMVIGKTEKDERQENSGLVTNLSFQVVGHPRNLARMANLLKQGNVNTNLIIKATNAATDVKVETIDLEHQMTLDTALKTPPKETKPEDKSIPGSTPVRSGEPIVPASSEGLGEKTKIPILGTCINCGYMQSAQELAETQGKGPCPVCGKSMTEVQETSGNGHKDPEQLAATEEANALFQQMGDTREKLETADKTAAGAGAETTEKTKRRSRKKKGEETPA